MVVRQSLNRLIYTSDDKMDMWIYPIYTFRCGAGSKSVYIQSGRHSHATDLESYNKLFKTLNLKCY